MQKTVKHGFSSQEGHLAQMSLPLIFRQRGSREYNEDKGVCIGASPCRGSCIMSDLKGRSIKIHCEDDLTLAIVWDSGNFVVIYVAWIIIWMIPSDVVFLLESSMRICLGNAESHLSE